MRLFATLLVLLVACGSDEPTPQKQLAQPAAPAVPAPAPGTVGPGAGSGKPLPIVRHSEDRVNCPTPREGSKKCDPAAIKLVASCGPKDKAPATPAPEDMTCKDDDVCLNTTVGYLCGPCPERLSIRQELRDRDFASETNRDPFQPSGSIKLPGAGSGSAGELSKDPASKCVRNEQLRVTNYGYQDLKLVGIVSQGTQRKVLMMDPGNYGHIIKRGDCVGKEKAWVKDIGENFICFEMSAELAAANRLPEGQCIELHNKQLTVTQLPQSTTDTPVAPVLPSGTGGPAPQQGPTSSTTTTIVPGRPQPQPQPQPPPAPRDPPVNIKP